MNATRPSSRSTLLASTIAVPLLGACNAMPSTTIDGHDAFERHALRIDLASTSSAEALARCFEESAGLLPGSTITAFGDSGDFAYRLRAGRFVFETIEMSPVEGGGSRAVVQVTPDYKARMREDFVSNRLTPMYRCAGTSTVPKWPAQAMAGRAVRS
jgi:hypothetical protein